MVTGTINNYNWIIEARQPLFTGGGLWANYQASRIAEDAAAVEVTAKSLDVVQDVKIAYFNILRSQRLAENARQAGRCFPPIRRRPEFLPASPHSKEHLLQTVVEQANGGRRRSRRQTPRTCKPAPSRAEARGDEPVEDREMLTPPLQRL